MRRAYTLDNLPKALVPYRHLIEDVYDDLAGRTGDKRIQLTLISGYHVRDEETHAVVESTVKKAAYSFKHLVYRATDCEECNEELAEQ